MSTSKDFYFKIAIMSNIMNIIYYLYYFYSHAYLQVFSKIDLIIIVIASIGMNFIMKFLI